jgi:hypothetical protein
MNSKGQPNGDLRKAIGGMKVIAWIVISVLVVLAALMYLIFGKTATQLANPSGPNPTPPSAATGQRTSLEIRSGFEPLINITLL